VTQDKIRGLVVQSGGPTAVINQSLVGILTSAQKHNAHLETVYGARFGLHGVLHENLIDLSHRETQDQWPTLAQTPGAALGSARIKPKAQDTKRLFQVMEAHKIQYLFYIGGNDSAEAALLIGAEATANCYPLRILHIPKTIDNDLMMTHHCPGYGSAANVVAHFALADDLDNQSFQHSIKINVCMGRHAGWLAAASAWAGPHIPQLIYMPEIPFQLSKFVQDVQWSYETYGRATVVVAEGIADHLINGTGLGDQDMDEFGNPSRLSGTGKLGDYLVCAVEKHFHQTLNIRKLRIRSDTWGYIQRTLPNMVSTIDANEAFRLGEAAVTHAVSGISHKMLTLQSQGADVPCDVGLCPLEDVAQKTRLMPRDFINALGNGVTPAFLDYLKPLMDPITPVQMLKEPRLIQKKLPPYQR